MRILLTRGQGAAARTAEKLAAKGHHAIISSVLNMVATQTPWPNGIVDAVMATSAQAFDLIRLDADWPMPETRRLLPLFLVGAHTAAAARDRGFEGAALVAADAQDLAAQIQHHARRPKEMLYLAGRTRKSELEERLIAMGLRLAIHEVYEAEAAERLTDEAISFLLNGEIDAVLHFSRRSADIFLDLASAEGVNVALPAHMAISEDAAGPLREADLPHIAVASEPTEKSVLDLIEAEPMPQPSVPMRRHDLA